MLKALVKRGASRGAWGLRCLRPGSGKWNWVRARPLVAIWGTATGEEESRAWEHEDVTSAGLHSLSSCLWLELVCVPTTLWMPHQQRLPTHHLVSSRTTGPLPNNTEAQGNRLLIHKVSKTTINNVTFVCNVTNALGSGQNQITVHVKGELSSD